MATLEKKRQRANEDPTCNSDNENITQVLNANTGHWILRDKKNGRYVVGGEEPFESVSICEVGTGMPHPAINRELALKVERAMADVMNNRTQKTQ